MFRPRWEKLRWSGPDGKYVTVDNPTDPQHRRLLRSLKRHFETDERALKQLKRSKKNPSRRHSKKWDRCVRKVTRSRRVRDPFAVCTSAVGNPRSFGVVLYAVKGKKDPILRYVGGVKFSDRQAPVAFPTVAIAQAFGRMLKRSFPILRTYRLVAR